MSRLVRFRFGHPIKPLRRTKSALIAAALLALLVFVPMSALAQGSPFDTGFNAIQSLFTGTIAKVGGWPASPDFRLRHFSQKVPHPCVFRKGGRRCCGCRLLSLSRDDQTRSTHAFLR
jgi:hypothetical protein